MNAADELPFGKRGDLVEELVPIAADLIQTMREEGPNAVRGALLRVPTVTEADLDATPGGVWGVFAMVCAAFAGEEITMRQALGWTEDLIEGAGAQRVIEDRVQASAAREHARLARAGVRTPTAADVLAPSVARAQESTSDRMLRVVRGGKASA